MSQAQTFDTRQKQVTPRATTMESAIAHVVEFLSQIEPPSHIPKLDRKRVQGRHVGLEYFSECEPFFGRFVDAGSDLGVFYRTDMHPNQVEKGNYDVCLIVSNDEKAESAIGLSRVRNIPLKLCRGRKTRSPYIAEVAALGTAKNWQNGQAVTYYRVKTGVWSVMDDIRSIQATRPAMHQHSHGWGIKDYTMATSIGSRSEIEQEESMRIQLAISMAFMRQYQWRVVIESQSGISLSLTTSPTGIRRLFRKREPSTESGRRKALRDWVTEHWRQIPEDKGGNDQTFVRQHLRGAVGFEWMGLKCSVRCPRFDDEQLQRHLEQREWMRELGLDRRVKPAEPEPKPIPAARQMDSMRLAAAEAHARRPIVAEAVAVPKQIAIPDDTQKLSIWARIWKWLRITRS